MDSMLTLLVFDAGLTLILLGLLWRHLRTTHKEQRKTEEIRQTLEEEKQKTNKFHVSLEEIRKMTQ